MCEIRVFGSTRAYAIKGRNYWLMNNELLETSALRERIIVERMVETGASRATMFKIVTRELAKHDMHTCMDVALNPF